MKRGGFMHACEKQWKKLMTFNGMLQTNWSLWLGKWTSQDLETMRKSVYGKPIAFVHVHEWIQICQIRIYVWAKDNFQMTPDIS